MEESVRWGFTRNAAAFFCVLLAMWYAGSSQQNAAVYLLLFTLASIGIVSIPHAICNVRGLTARTGSIKPTFAGEEASLPVEITNNSRTNRQGLRLHLPNATENFENIDQIPAGKAIRASIRFPTANRGEHEITSVCLQTTYPMGLARIVKHLPSRQRYLVYPKPGGDPKLPASGSTSAEDRPQRDSSEGQDFAGVRPYAAGESQRHIDWKAVARGQGLLTKLFSAETEAGLFHFDFAAVPSPQVEVRLSQLALWIIAAERARRAYGLRLPNLEISPSLGDQHFHRCLRALALFK